MCDGRTTKRCCCAKASCTYKLSASYTHKICNNISNDFTSRCFHSWRAALLHTSSFRKHAMYPQLSNTLKPGTCLYLCAHGHSNFTTLHLRMCTFAGATTGTLSSPYLRFTKSGNALALAPPLVGLHSLWITHLCHCSPGSHSIKMALYVLHTNVQCVALQQCVVPDWNPEQCLVCSGN
jgi:hypothetical protein